MKNNPALLRMMLDDETGQNGLYRPGPYWQGYQRRVLDAIERNGIERFRADAAVGKGYADILTHDASDLWLSAGGIRDRIKRALRAAPLLHKMFDDYQLLNESHLGKFLSVRSLYYQERYGDWLTEAERETPLPDSRHGGCESVIEINGKTHAAKYVELLMQICNFSDQVDFSRPRTAFEIGGGFGALSHLLLSRFHNIRKLVYLDIPPMIYIGTEYLRHHFGDAVIDYSQTRRRERIEFAPNDDLEIVCLCPWQVEQLQCAVDIFWNSASFSEMTPDIVANYAGHICRVLSAEDPAICLILNKPEGLSPKKTTRPHEILHAFGNDISFEAVVPKIGDNPHAFMHGRRATV
jgi:putative sugar O-methyltransferase